jgi:hypothetical protein
MVQKRKFVENQPEVGFYIKRSVLVNNALVEVFGIPGSRGQCEYFRSIFQLCTAGYFKR